MALIKTSKLEVICEQHPILIMTLSVVIQSVLALFLHIQICHIIQFFVGYFWCKSRSLDNKKKILFSSLILVLVFGIRFAMRSVTDNTVLYNHIIAPLSFVALGSWLFIISDYVLTKANSLSESIAGAYMWKKLDLLSFPLYLTHYLFLYSPFAIMSEHINSYFLLFIIATLVSAILLNLVSSMINNRISKKEF